MAFYLFFLDAEPEMPARPVADLTEARALIAEKHRVKADALGEAYVEGDANESPCWLFALPGHPVTETVAQVTRAAKDADVDSPKTLADYSTWLASRVELARQRDGA